MLSEMVVAVVETSWEMELMSEMLASVNGVGKTMGERKMRGKRGRLVF